MEEHRHFWSVHGCWCGAQRCTFWKAVPAFAENNYLGDYVYCERAGTMTPDGVRCEEHAPRFHLIHDGPGGSPL